MLIPLLIRLGNWQLARWQYKKELSFTIYTSLQQAPQFYIKQPTPPTLYKPYLIKGHFLQDKTLLLDNKIYNHQVGYVVLSPFLLSGTQQIILIDRGWVPLGSSRNSVPALLPTPRRELTLTGFFYNISSSFSLAEPKLSAMPIFPYRIQNVDVALLKNLFKKDIESNIFKLAETSSYTHQYQPVGLGTPPMKHLGYAVQWFMMAVATLVYYLFINCTYHRTKRLQNNDVYKF